MNKLLTKEELNKIALREFELKQLSENGHNLWGKKEQQRYIKLLAEISMIRNRSVMSNLNRALIILAFVLWITASILTESHIISGIIAASISGLGTASGIWGLIRHNNQKIN